MVTMSFGEHIEELRVRLILALIGLVVGRDLTFIPPLNLGQRVMKQDARAREDGARSGSTQRVRQEAPKTAEEAKESRPAVEAIIPAESSRRRPQADRPRLDLPRPRSSRARRITAARSSTTQAELIQMIPGVGRSRSTTP